MRTILLGCFIAILFCSCFDLQVGAPIHKIATGIWKGVFVIGEEKIPVIFEVARTDNDSLLLTFKDGNHTTRATQTRKFGDSLFVDFGESQKQLRIKVDLDEITGFLLDKENKEYPIQFIGQFANHNRFPDVRQTPKADLTGDWRMTISLNQDAVQMGSLRLTTKGNFAEGKLLLPNGIEIPLEGTIQDDKLILSGFNGSQVALVSATVTNAQVLTKGNLIVNNTTYYWTATASAGVEQPKNIPTN